MNKIIQLINNTLKAARGDNTRRLVVLSGEREWCYQVALRWLDYSVPKHPLWVGDANKNNVPSSPEKLWQLSAGQARQSLGREVDALVFDAWAGLNPDALAASAGCLVGGGVMLLLTPALADWPRYPDPDYQRMLSYPHSVTSVKGRFINHLIDCLAADKDVLQLSQAQVHSLALPTKPQMLEKDSPRPFALTADQQAAIAAIQKVATGRSKRPLVITSHRGRGKSTAMGLAAAALLQSSSRTVLVTAPRADAVDALFQHAASQLSIPAQQGYYISVSDRSLSFFATDKLIHECPAADLLLVDEAAAIPAAMLEKLVLAYPRIVFATTVQGYEGSGRGFEIRFKNRLTALRPQWRALSMSLPVRWSEGDPLETTVDRMLLMDAMNSHPKSDGPPYSEMGESTRWLVEKLDRDCLLEDKNLLRSLFSLLLVAHYQTSPTDLRSLLDGPNVSIWVIRLQDQVLAAALVGEEGGLNGYLGEAIWRGERRPQGHLLPQTLSYQAGFKQAADFTYWRVLRVAVDPQWQRGGIGRELIDAIAEQARHQQVDFLGSSFAATADVVQFWSACGCVPVHLGNRRDTCSGSYSVVVVLALSAVAMECFVAWRKRFVEQCSQQLLTTYGELEPLLVASLLRAADGSDFSISNESVLNEFDWQDIHAFAAGHRQLAGCRLALRKLLLQALVGAKTPSASPQQCLLIQCLLQNQPVSRLVAQAGCDGKKALMGLLQTGVASLINNKEINNKQPGA